MPLEEMARRANQVAAVSVQAVGTQKSYPERTGLPAELFWEQPADTQVNLKTTDYWLTDQSCLNRKLNGGCRSYINGAFNNWQAS